MFDSWSNFLNVFFAASGFMFWLCFVGFIYLVVRRIRNKKRGFYEQ
jgi:hypothetical protein